MVEIAPGWRLNVEQGPDWLFVKLNSPDQDAADSPALAERLWALMEQHSAYRLVLELEELAVLYTYLIGQLVLLHKRVCAQGGLMRLCGLSPGNQQVLQLCRLDDRFPPYRTREEAVVGHCPR